MGLLAYSTGMNGAGSADPISIISHELKTPLTSLRLALHCLRRPQATPETMEKELSLAIRQVSYLTELVDSISQWSSGDRLPITLERTSLTELVRQAVSDFLYARRASISLELENGVFVKGDPTRLRQVVANLVSNAVNYGAGNEVRVSLSRQDGACVLAVSDRGRGIGSEDLARIFEPFQRISRSNHVRGLGLGLFVVKKIVEAHHADIRVESELGEGSTFYVCFPALD